MVTCGKFVVWHLDSAGMADDSLTMLSYRSGNAGTVMDSGEPAIFE